MDVKKRMLILRVLQEIEDQPEFSKKIGLKNTSHYKSEEERQVDKIEVCSDRFGNEQNI